MARMRSIVRAIGYTKGTGMISTGSNVPTPTKIQPDSSLYAIQPLKRSVIYSANVPENDSAHDITIPKDAYLHIICSGSEGKP